MDGDVSVVHFHEIFSIWIIFNPCPYSITVNCHPKICAYDSKCMMIFNSYFELHGFALAVDGYSVPSTLLRLLVLAASENVHQLVDCDVPSETWWN